MHSFEVLAIEVVLFGVNPIKSKKVNGYSQASRAGKYIFIADYKLKIGIILKPKIILFCHLYRYFADHL